MPLRITTWNVNGIRNPFGYQPWRDKKTFEAMFDILETDIVIMQELKIQRKDLRDDMVLVNGWDCFFSLPRHKKGYSGVGIYTRQAACVPIRAEEGVLGVLNAPATRTPYCELPSEQHIGGYLSDSQLSSLGVDAVELDSEGRCVVIEFPAFVLLGVYSPANSSGLRDDFRHDFLRALDFRIRNLVKQGKSVILTGDLNVSREEIDTANSEETIKKEGLTHEDYVSTPNRRIFNQLLEGGDVVGERDEGREHPVLWDICRGFHPHRKGMYTHWEQKINARPGNFGSRIDYILCSLDMKDWFCDSNIQEGLMGSDHCPVYAVLKDEITINGEKKQTLDCLSPLGMFLEGKRQFEHSSNLFLPFSARLLPEFDKRRSIKDMFHKKPATQQAVEESAIGTLAQLESLPQERVSSQPLKQDTTEKTKVPENSSQQRLDKHSAEHSSSPSKKRSASDALPTRSLKRSRSGANGSMKDEPPAGQKSLTGFFKPASSSKRQDPVIADSNETTASLSPRGEITKEFSNDTESLYKVPTTGLIPKHTKQDKDATENSVEQQPSTESADDIPTNLTEEDFVDPIVSKESWDKLFSKPNAPRCESHDEPCQLLKTKKAGFNCGREFFMCSRPLGPSGTKERNTQWRCTTFIWRSDWNNGVNREQ